MNRDEVIKKLKETRARLKYQSEAIDRTIQFVESEPAIHYIAGLFHGMVREEIDSTKFATVTVKDKPSEKKSGAA